MRGPIASATIPHDKGGKGSVQAVQIIKPEELWKHFPSGRIFKGGGNLTDPKMVSMKGLRPVDFDIVKDPKTGQEMVMPNRQKGLSLSTTIDRLAKLRIEGTVWELASPATLPVGLVINFDWPEHPLVNVAGPTPLAHAIHLLKELGKLMKSTGVKITSKGVITK